jgi:hypothetical protein
MAIMKKIKSTNASEDAGEKATFFTIAGIIN